MIDTSHGVYYAVCDICGHVTGPFMTWEDAREHMHNRKWRFYYSAAATDWQHYCAQCKATAPDSAMSKAAKGN